MEVSLQQENGIQFWHSRGFQSLGFKAVFFRRPGGTSQGRYAGLNLGMNTGDDCQAVLKNRSLAYRAAGFGPLWPALGQQVHQTHFHILNRKHAGRGWFAFTDALKFTDGLFTAESGLPVGIAVADCLPVLLACERPRVVAAVHAGWRGLAGHIVEKAVRAFRQQWGISSAKLWAAMGPAIGPEAFIIRDEVLGQLRALCPQAVVGYKSSQSEAGFDLWKAATAQLESAGVSLRKIITVRESMADHLKNYYSYRREGETGRTLGMIQIEP